MSSERTPREGEEPRPKEGQAPGQAEDPPQPPGKPGKAPRKPYVFKFQPADPKNDLEFEDMADK